MTLAKLSEQIQKYKKFRPLKHGKAVFGKCLLNAKVMLIGQNPGKEEGEIGKPFVGRSGKFLDKVLANTNSYSKEQQGLKP